MQEPSAPTRLILETEGQPTPWWRKISWTPLTRGSAQGGVQNIFLHFFCLCQFLIFVDFFCISQPAQLHPRLPEAAPPLAPSRECVGKKGFEPHRCRHPPSPRPFLRMFPQSCSPGHDAKRFGPDFLLFTPQG